AVTIATAPLWALAPPPPPAAYPPVVEAPSAAYVQPVYSTSPGIYQQAPGYARPEPPPFQREVVYADGRYLLFGDGVRHAWQWVWVPASAPPPPPPPPRSREGRAMAGRAGCMGRGHLGPRCGLTVPPGAPRCAAHASDRPN